MRCTFMNWTLTHIIDLKTVFFWYIIIHIFYFVLVDSLRLQNIMKWKFSLVYF